MKLNRKEKNPDQMRREAVLWFGLGTCLIYGFGSWIFGKITESGFEMHFNPIPVLLAMGLGIGFCFFYRRYRFVGFFKKGKLKVGFLWILLPVVLEVVRLCVGVEGLRCLENTQWIEWVLGGITEELLFRGLALSLLVLGCCRRRQYLGLVLIDGVIFALFHLANVMNGADLSWTLVQSFCALGYGVYYACLYLNSGHLIFPILCHCLHNLVAGVVGASGMLWVDPVIAFGLMAFSIGQIVFGQTGILKQLWKMKWCRLPQSFNGKGEKEIV